uniref:Rho-GAP domain-containing protein n=1 Tax=Haemonchus placei TaxID=6290 RepID=A0A0N4W6B4_HAEPC
LKEGGVQMTSLTTLLSHHRYLFLYHDTLVISKQKGACSYKLKEKLRLNRVWVASSNSADSFLIGWPFCNYLVHFRSRSEKEEWYELFSYCVQQCLRPLSTTIAMDINVRGRKQVIRRRIDNGKKSGELVMETAADLGLSHTSYELRLVVGEGSGKTLQGPENVYVVIMSEIERQGIRLSDSQRQSLDACPIANARLILSNIKSSKSSSPMQIVNNIKKRVLQRSDSRGIFGRELDGPTPPQPVMSIVDHLRMHGYDMEGVFRKSPKQSTLRECRSEIERGLVPDYKKYGTHVLASVLKDYLRSIPGKILLSGNYDLWIKEVVDEADHEKKVRTLLGILPKAHAILLTNVLKLLNKIASSPSSKMTASALSVCLAPSFLETQSSDPLESGKKIPLLVEFLILNASEVMPPGFNSDNIFSILNSVDHNANHLCSPEPTCSDDEGSQRTPIIEEVDGGRHHSIQWAHDCRDRIFFFRSVAVLEKKSLFQEEPPSRKESREEATQTPDCGLPRIGDCHSRFPAFRGSVTHSQEVADAIVEPQLRAPSKEGNHVPSQEPILRTITGNGELRSSIAFVYLLQSSCLCELGMKIQYDVSVYDRILYIRIHNSPPTTYTTAASVKSVRRADACVGMDSLEINWSVRQLKTLFQDKRAPSINTDYTTS